MLSPAPTNVVPADMKRQLKALGRFLNNHPHCHSFDSPVVWGSPHRIEIVKMEARGRQHTEKRGSIVPSGSLR